MCRLAFEVALLYLTFKHVLYIIQEILFMVDSETLFVAKNLVLFVGWYLRRMTKGKMYMRMNKWGIYEVDWTGPYQRVDQDNVRAVLGHSTRELHVVRDHLSRGWWPTSIIAIVCRFLSSVFTQFVFVFYRKM